MKKFYIQNFGCRATQADGAALEGLLEKQGLAAAEGAQAADLVILNTCTVTSSADDDVRKSIHRVHRENPKARILVTGCYAQRAPEELSRIPGVTWVVGNSHKTEIPGLIPRINQAEYHGQILVGDISAATGFLSSPVDDAFGDRTRPNLKIQEGCNNVCTFCIIPSVRGRSRSMTLEQVLGELRGLAANYREIVLTGINLGRWGREAGFRPTDRMRLSDLLRVVLDQTPVERLRISSVEPMDFTDELLELMASSSRIAKHVHAPLQSASDTVLKRMKRRYRSRHYEDRLRRAHGLMPNAAFGADVMTGFPGETAEEFQQTYDFIERLPFTYLHVFTYSERPGTPAVSHAEPVPHQVRKERTRRLRDLAARKNLAFRTAQQGRVLSAVTLDNGKALTENYLPVEMAVPRGSNQLVELMIGGVTSAGLSEAGFLPPVELPQQPSAFPILG
ncbi:tRNA (N(6)-L-threonylcarbamoyladenosine(37)-C(2))-methylthiotransferase MtaB [Paludibaculum fermentans]|uniref:tRNA (N(6)-L-threonylcarbamoyladenosine(37)-C(2))-methylthiotransferase MtaB n=1 Tax=Paludibaculum fermentans TaxID=1473598 RepID=A0A7S7SL74_PALFE|nr:tRNA (N(6)-L-threonylcarbamoyladenosine(37)-C(2))-methylthiotransferase MtaB [Paludibaculum fermentans]QOY88523.1 tRNA (N(6)-L-threonylcarbamoyladenosine(37)-C(2))-methylthiotransferase MtaB [Paludibaculum fermentans]